MCRRVLSLGTAVAIIGGLCIASSTAVAADNSDSDQRWGVSAAPLRGVTLSTMPGPHGLPLLARGGGGDELFAGNPTCTPDSNDNSIGISSVGAEFFQQCQDGAWAGLGFPVLTNGDPIESVNLILTGVGGDDSGDLYLMGDANGPDTNNILFTGCGCIGEFEENVVLNFPIGEPIVDPPAIVWVVTVYRTLEADGTPPTFFQAGDTGLIAPNHGFANLSGGPGGAEWLDLNDFGFGWCYWVSLVTAAAPGVPPCCDSGALCDGDVNGDGEVTPLDTGFILARFGLDASDPANCAADANCDGIIDPLDNGYVLARFGLCNEPCSCPLGGGACGECDDGKEEPDSCAVPPTQDCCEVHSDPGCNAVCGEPDDGGVEECVCNVDDFCCMVTWDSACVEIVELFGCADCSDNNPDCFVPPVCPGEGDCCVANGSVGCDDVDCCELICGIDPFCCDTSWDQVCADQALDLCDLCVGCDPPCGPFEICVDGVCVSTCPDGGPDNDCCENVPVDSLSPGGSLTYNATLTGANPTCAALGALGETWHAFDLSATANVSTSHCGTIPVFGNAFIVIDPECPCSGAFIFADNFNQDDCADGNWTLNYPALPAGDYWTPIILDPGFGNDGPYVWNIEAN